MEPFEIDDIGPGVWYTLHLMTAKAKSSDEIRACHVLIKMLAEGFFCETCRKHFRDNVKDLPPPTTNKVNELFAWSVEMHNRVNVMNGKDSIDHMEALDYYVGHKSRCHGDCGRGRSNPVPGTPYKTSRPNLRVSESLLNTLTSGDRSKFVSTDRRSLY